ncbi:uncharacterized protein LOC134159489 [Pezoporus occidentalis]|uniref:uncharacterized protein LOC134159489 n=1 Tax=Pezoporus occidentalis TaxID=407982 RepID=UPI002F91BC65
MRCPAVQACSHRRHGCLAPCPLIFPRHRPIGSSPGLSAARPASPQPVRTALARGMRAPSPLPDRAPQLRDFQTQPGLAEPGHTSTPNLRWRWTRRLHRVTTLPCRRVKLRASLQRPLCTVTLPAPGLRQIPAEHPGAVRGSVPRPCGGCLRFQNPFKGSAPPRHGERAHRKRSGGSRGRSFVVIKILPPRRDRICIEAIPQGAGLTRRAAAPGEGWPFPRGSALIYVRTAARRGRPRTAETATSHGEAAGPGAPTRDRADGGDVPGLASHATDTCRCSARSRAALSPHGERRARPGCLRAPLPGVPALVHPPG